MHLPEFEVFNVFKCVFFVQAARGRITSVCVYRTVAITFHLDGLQVPAEDGERNEAIWRQFHTVRTLALIQTDTHTCTSAKIAKRSHATFDPAALRIIELVLSLRPLGWRLTRSFHNLCLIYEGFGAACAAYIMFRIWGSSSDCIASRVENGDKTPSAAQWILFSNETLTPIWLWYLQMGHDESTRIGGVEQLFFRRLFSSRSL